MFLLLTFNFKNPFIIAEIGGNHEGSLDYAKDLLIKAAEGGADAVKFQTFTADKMTFNSKKRGFIIKDKKKSKSNDYSKKLVGQVEQEIELKNKFHLNEKMRNFWSEKCVLGQNKSSKFGKF